MNILKILFLTLMFTTLVACGGSSSSGESEARSNDNVENNLPNSSTKNSDVNSSDGSENSSSNKSKESGSNNSDTTPKSDSKLSNQKSPMNFTLAVIPDTQFLSRDNPSIFRSQTRWISENYKKENIKFTVHLGDVVQNPEKDSEWLVAVQAMSLLDRNPETPYSILAGNHDIQDIALGIFDDASTNKSHRDANRNPKREQFTRFFSVQKQEQNFSTFKGADTTGLNSYHTFFDDSGQEYLVLALDWRISDKTIDWVKLVLKQHGTLPVILTTHELLDPRGISEGAKPAKMTPNGKRLWDNLINENDQIFITFNGHWNGEGYRLEKNKYGRSVLMIGVDYQNEYKGGNGMMQLVEFDKSANKLNFRSYSPYVQELLNVMKNVSKDVKLDKKNILNRWKFSIPLNFQERFSNFNQK